MGTENNMSATAKTRQLSTVLADENVGIWMTDILEASCFVGY